MIAKPALPGNGEMTIHEAKERLNILDLWRIFQLPEKPGRSCRCPWRDDHKPSFSVSEDGMLWHDFATGQGGDAIDFLAMATGLSPKDACKRFIEMAGGQSLPYQPLAKRPAPAPRASQKPVLPPMRLGKPDEHAALARLRHVHLEAVRIAENVGFLRFGDWKGVPAWFIMDDTKCNVQARRMDGKPWAEIGGAKAWNLPGSWASWPIGAGLGAYEKLCLVEGGPDLLAALHFIILEGMVVDVAPVAMLGAGHRIHPDALPLLAGKRVRIMAHADEAGRNAAQRWRGQLVSVGCRVDAVDFSGLRKADGAPIDDLNDCTQIHPDDAGELEGVLP